VAHQNFNAVTVATVAVADYINLTPHQKLAQEMRIAQSLRITLPISQVDKRSQRPKHHNYIGSSHDYLIYNIYNKYKN